MIIKHYAHLIKPTTRLFETRTAEHALCAFASNCERNGFKCISARDANGMFGLHLFIILEDEDELLKFGLCFDLDSKYIEELG